MPTEGKISAETVRDDFNDPLSVVHYARAAHFLGLWKSEAALIERHFPDRSARLLEAGCGAGRATLGLWHLGYRDLTAFDFAEEPLEQARELAAAIGASIRFLPGDATRLEAADPWGRIRSGECPPFDGIMFLFNGLMQIPGRANRRAALRALRAVSRSGARFLFTTHDRDASRVEQARWSEEAARWARGEEDPRLTEFGDRYFEDEAGRTFMHLPDREEIISDLSACDWILRFDALRREVAAEPRAVRQFSDECRFWLAQAG
ncbi:MAG: class I SAM-dependent methyltransferase, partial [Opitutaceae bacterium]